MTANPPSECWMCGMSHDFGDPNCAYQRQLRKEKSSERVAPSKRKLSSRRTLSIPERIQGAKSQEAYPGQKFFHDNNPNIKRSEMNAANPPSKRSPVELVATYWACVCGHMWLSRVKNPKKCPGCGRKREISKGKRAYKL